MALTVADIAARPELRDTLAASPFDFAVGSYLAADADSWFRVESSESFTAIATDGSGGIFLTGVSSGSVLYVSSEGQAGMVASSVLELLQLIVAHPEWLDILTCSGGGSLAEMRRAAVARDLATGSLYARERDFLRNELALPPVDPIGLLHAAVSRTGVGVYAPDGSAFDGLFGSFTLNDAVQTASGS